MPQSKAEILRGYVEANPLMKPSELADLVGKDYPGLYPTRKTMRAEICKLSMKVRTPEIRFKDSRKDTTEDNPFALPAAFELEYDPYHIPEGVGTAMILGDIHLPFHDVKAITAAMDYGKRRGVDSIILNGDICDIYHGSRFAKDPKMPPIREEVNACRTLFAALRKTFKDALIVMKEGNHDERFMANLLGKAPEYAQLEGFTLRELTHADRYGIAWVDEKRIIKAGKLPIYHGHEFAGGGTGGVSPARSLFLKLYTNGACSHFHRTTEHASKRGDGKLVTCWSIGCMCQLHPDYARNNQWNQGFAVVSIDGEEFEFENRRVFSGQIY